MLFETPKDKFKYLLSNFNTAPSLVELKLSDFYSLSDSVINSSINTKIVNGTKDSKTLTNAMIHALDKYCPAKGSRVLYKSLFDAHIISAPPNMSANSNTVYFQIYFSTDHIYIYELDNFARVINSHVIKTNDIQNIEFKNNNTVITSKTTHSHDVIKFILEGNENFNLLEIFKNMDIPVVITN